MEDEDFEDVHDILIEKEIGKTDLLKIVSEVAHQIYFEKNFKEITGTSKFSKNLECFF